MPYHGINAHLEPFLPYIEKAPSTPLNTPWHLPNSLSRPISIGTVKSWLATCDRHHGTHCNRGPQLAASDQQPTFLIDVRRACLVLAAPDAVYATLSYVWGQARGGADFSLTSDTRHDLQIEGSLDKVDLPRTIRDAMRFVAALDVPYLWVDRLCIIQDSVEHKHGQIKAMASIYSNSCFTIIAAQSHDASGPLSSRPLRSPAPDRWSTLRSISKSLVSLTKVIGPSKRAAVPSVDPTSPWRRPQTDRDVMAVMSADLLRTIWYSRGWTFQEFLFSRRKIIFHNNTINWECHCTSAHEERATLSKETCSRPPVHESPLGVDIDVWPNFHRYARLASLITPRNFTFPEDVLDAFAGASTALAKVYPGGLVTGIPVMVFDAALIWQPYHPMERRKAVAMPREEAVLPSWSWVSWRGNVQSESWQSGYDYLVAQDEGADQEVQPRWSTFPTVQWYHSATLASTRFPIKSDAPEWRTRFPGEITQDPIGWQRGIDTDGRRVYTYQDIIGHQFRYPIPIGIGDGRALRSRYIHCKTRHAKLPTTPKPYRAFASGCVFLALQDHDGKLVGTLRLNSSDRDKRSTEPLDLIELSCGSVELRHSGKDLLDHHFADVFDEWVLPEWENGAQDVYEFYNVMHVQWAEPGVASRLAVGRVEKRAWERLAVGEIEVSIG